MIKVIVLLFGLCSTSFALNKRGSYLYEYLFYDVYQISLWTETKSEEGFDQEIQLKINYLMDLKGRDIGRQSVKEIKGLGYDKKLVQDWEPLLLSFFPNIQKGDSISAYLYPGRSLVFKLNDEKIIGEFKDLKIAHAFLEIWLGENSSDRKMREALLKRSDHES